MESSSKFERLRDIAIETLRYFSSELFYLIQFLREQILDFCDNAKRRKIGFISKTLHSKIFFCQIASDLNLKQKEFEKFELLKSTSKSTLIHVRQAVSGAFRWWNRLVFVVFTFFLPQKYKHAQDNNLKLKRKIVIFNLYDPGYFTCIKHDLNSSCSSHGSSNSKLNQSDQVFFGLTKKQQPYNKTHNRKLGI